MPGGGGGKGRKQPYVLFCQEQSDVDPALRGKTLPQLVSLCNERWTSLEPRDRQRYVDMAREYNRPGAYPGSEPPPADGDWRGRFDCYGRSMAALKLKAEMAEYDKAVMVKDIAQRVTEAADRGNVENLRIHVLNVREWCETAEGLEGGRLLPAEVGLVEMTLRGGVGRVVHALVDPGCPPRGYKGTMKAMSEKYHKIWLDNPQLTDDYPAIMEAFTNLLTVRRGERRAGAGIDVDGFAKIRDAIDKRDDDERKTSDSLDFLPIYCLPGGPARTAAKALKWLQARAGTNFAFKYYELHHLFVQLLRAAPIAAKEPTLNIAEAHLTRDVYLYTPGVSCRFHERVECPLCAAGASVRQCLILCDFCCRVYGIVPVEGRHTPWGVAPPADLVEAIGSDTSSEKSSDSDRSFVTAKSRAFHSGHEFTGGRGGLRRTFQKHPLEGIVGKNGEGEFVLTLDHIKDLPTASDAKKGGRDGEDSRSVDLSFLQQSKALKAATASSVSSVFGGASERLRHRGGGDGMSTVGSESIGVPEDDVCRGGHIKGRRTIAW